MFTTMVSVMLNRYTLVKSLNFFSSLSILLDSISRWPARENCQDVALNFATACSDYVFLYNMVLTFKVEPSGISTECRTC